MITYKTLTIAGFDGSGGAGIQADLKTFSALGCYGMSVLTALPVQNTQGVKSCYPIPLKAIHEQLETIFEDIVPDAIKIGMLFDTPVIKVVCAFLKKNAAHIPIVVDPVMIAKSGDALLDPNAITTIINELLPISTVLTPNIPEAHTLSSIDISSEAEMLIAAKKLLNMGPKYVLLKGGHLHDTHSNDLLIGQNSAAQWFKNIRIASKNTHGTGCTLSAAITACLAQKIEINQACLIAKNYLFKAIKHSKTNSVGLGNGPVHHFYHQWPINLESFK